MHPKGTAFLLNSTPPTRRIRNLGNTEGSHSTCLFQRRQGFRTPELTLPSAPTRGSRMRWRRGTSILLQPCHVRRLGMSRIAVVRNPRPISIISITCSCCFGTPARAPRLRVSRGFFIQIQIQILPSDPIVRSGPGQRTRPHERAVCQVEVPRAWPQTTGAAHRHHLTVVTHGLIREVEGPQAERLLFHTRLQNEVGRQ